MEDTDASFTFWVLAFFFWLLPIILTLVVASSKGRSKHFVWWAVGFSWIGFFVSSFVLLMGPTQTMPQKRVEDRQSDERLPKR